MIPLLAAVLLAQAPEPPTDVRLDAFRAACVPHRQDLVAAAAAMAEDGWTPAADSDHSELASTMANARANAVDPELEMTADFSIWKKRFDGRYLFVVLNRADAVLRAADHDDDGDGVIQDWEKADTMTFLGCGLWDFDAEAPMDPAVVTAWVGAEPIQTIDAPGVIQGGTWNVYDMMPGTAEVQAGFIPYGGMGFDQAGFSGVSITMTSAPKAVTDAHLSSQSGTAPDAD